MSSEIVTPGQRLANVGEFEASLGTYELGDHIYASVVGVRQELDGASNGVLKKLQVTRRKEQSSIPEVDSIVTGRVIRVNPRMATLAIMVVGSTPCTENFQGVIRVQDVRATEKDKVQIYKSFRPGDIVRAQVISLGDARSYYLSTARNDLGVIFAQSDAGHTMIPISWEEMICPKTKVIENRKCAKPSE
ncbi:Exosome complex component CSL4 [Chytridiales sp. JEL 0842]|nr:Exosome complex component CSL4 [Chytridiales sp. JEL 0842]